MQFQTGASLVLGGARSGKSTFAETLADQSGFRKIYLATSQAFDDEMESRIDLHRARRGDDWQLIEEPLDLAATLENCATPDTCVLVDCLTLWITNMMMESLAVEEHSKRLCKTIATCKANGANILFVSNEVGQGIVPIDKMAREFRDHAGRLHQDLASVVDHVWFVTAGLPQKLK